MKRTIIRHFFNQLYLVGITLSCIACSGLEKGSEHKKRRRNQIIEKIQRKKEEHFALITLTKKESTPYLWEDKYIHTMHRITKEFFRCRGSYLNPPIQIQTQPKQVTYQSDCNGNHGLPMRQGKEFIYPILIEVLNEIQTKTKCPVYITCGHRCPTHNRYAEPQARHSKHMIGAEVDFYVKDMEFETKKIISLIINYFQKDPLNRISPTSWSNREIILIAHPPHQKRDKDNQHPYPYLTLEVKYDKENKKPLRYSWYLAERNFFRC